MVVRTREVRLKLSRHHKVDSESAVTSADAGALPRAPPADDCR